MSMQRVFLITAWLTLFSYGSFAVYLLVANSTGIETCCDPLPPATIMFATIKLLTAFVFLMLMLATAKGWGVVNPQLSRSDRRQILTFAVVYVVVRLLTRWVEQARLLALFVEIFLWVWIFRSIRLTRHDLELSSRPDRHGKLEMYVKLRKLVLVSILTWVLIVSILIITIVMILARDGKGFGPLSEIPPTLASDVAMLILFLGFGIIWAPSPATAQYSYLASREYGIGEDEEANIETSRMDHDDPVSEFGLESS